MFKKISQLLCLSLIIAASSSHAFELQPLVTERDATTLKSRLLSSLQTLEDNLVIAYVDHFSTPVHEDRRHN